MTYNAARHFTAKPAPGGGVTLSLRHKFRDQPTSFLPKSELRDQEGYEGPIAVPTSSGRVRNRVFTFGPLVQGERYEFEELPNGLVAVVVTTNTSDYPGEGGRPTDGTTDARSAYLANSLGGEARQLASMNQSNRTYFKR